MHGDQRDLRLRRARWSRRRLWRQTGGSGAVAKVGATRRGAASARGLGLSGGCGRRRREQNGWVCVESEWNSRRVSTRSCRVGSGDVAMLCVSRLFGAGIGRRRERACGLVRLVCLCTLACAHAQATRPGSTSDLAQEAGCAVGGCQWMVVATRQLVGD